MLRKELIFTIILLTFLIPVTRCACGAGLYKTGGVCTVCVAGSYCSGSDTTATCSTGYYSMAGASACTQCPAGFYCTTKASLPVKCAAGTYSAAGASLCSSCGAGYVCPDGLQVACTSGSTYQTTGGKTYCDACPVGYLCTASSATACSAGAYASAGTSCATLSTGYYAPDKGSSRQCPVGFYIDSTQTTCVACEAGNYCNDGDTKTACTTGLCPAEVTAAITLATGMTPSTAVLMSATAFCAAGYKYATSTCTICATGKYCPDPTTSTETACVAGTYNSGTGKMFCYGCEPSSTCTVSTSTVLGAGSYTSDNM